MQRLMAQNRKDIFKREHWTQKYICYDICLTLFDGLNKQQYGEAVSAKYFET